MLDGVVFHLVVVFGVPDLLEGLAEPDLLNAGGLALFATPVVVIVAPEVRFLIVQVHLGTAFSADYCFHILSFLPVQPIGQLLNLHFQIVSLSLHRTRTVILSTLGCVNWYASIHFAMSLSGIAW